MLSPVNLTYRKLYDAYDALLEANPGKSLKVSNGMVMFRESDEIYSCTLAADGSIDEDTVGAISECAWNDADNCWDYHPDSETTVAEVNNPVFIE